MEDRRELVEHLVAHALRTDGPFVLRSGLTSSWYLDARQTTFDGRGARLVGEAVLALLDERVVAVGGMTMGSDPIAIATAMSGAERGRVLKAFSIRKAAKEHGTGGRLVGPVRAGDVAAAVEDTTSTGGAFLEAIDVMLDAGLEVVQAVALVDRSGGVVADRLADRGIDYSVVVDLAMLGVA